MCKRRRGAAAKRHSCSTSEIPGSIDVVREQYIVLNYLRLTSTGVSTTEIDGVSYDVHRVTPESDEPSFDVFFDIRAPAAWLRNNLN